MCLTSVMRGAPALSPGTAAAPNVETINSRRVILSFSWQRYRDLQGRRGLPRAPPDRRTDPSCGTADPPPTGTTDVRETRILRPVRLSDARSSQSLRESGRDASGRCEMRSSPTQDTSESRSDLTDIWKAAN